MYRSIIIFIGLATLVTLLRASEEAAPEVEEKPKYIITDEVWFDIVIKEAKEVNETIRSERVVIGLFGDIVPMTTTNFIQIAKGFKRDSKGKMKYHYKGSPIHRIVKDFVLQTGDVVNGDGTGSKSIYGDKFIDENFILSHRSAGWVSMANYGKDTNGSQFFVTLVPARWLDGHHVVFGRILSGMQYLRDISELETYKGSTLPKKHVEIADCGVRQITRYELSEDQLDSPGDIKSE